MVDVQAKEPSAAKPGLALWQLGFRPFFLLGFAIGIVALLVWLWALSGGVTSVDAYWHGHEMIHGFVVAIIVGFLYTASQNWTGVRGVHGPTLMLVVGVWAFGRLAFLWPGLSAPVVAAVDLVFLPVAGTILARYLLRQGQRQNLIFLALLSMLWLGNLTYHLDRTGAWPGAARGGLYFGVHVIVAITFVVAGRVLPFFTERAVPGYVRRQAKPLSLAVIVLAVAFPLAHLTGNTSMTTGLVALLAGMAAAARWALWLDRRILRQPLLWILYAAYAWLIAGFFLAALASTGRLPASVAVHAFTAGGISSMIVGMVSRVSLGHTGRPLVASPLTVVAYCLVLGSGVLRVFGPLAFPAAYLPMMQTAGVLWALALAAILIGYTPKLLLPRPDGRPG